MKNLRSTCEKTQEKLRETEKELAAAHAENQSLRLQVIQSTHLSHAHPPVGTRFQKTTEWDKWVLKWPVLMSQEQRRNKETWESFACRNKSTLPDF